MKLHVTHFADAVELSRNAANLVVRSALQGVDRKGSFTLVLSGGQTPETLYRLLSQAPFRETMPWSCTHFFWGDERFVPRDSKQSNYLTAWNAMLSIVPVPHANIHPVPVEAGNPEQAAMEYERTLREFPGPGRELGTRTTPSLDLILLGMGTDGHTASLFPGDPAVEEPLRWVVSVEGTTADPPIPRVTLTLPAINSASRVLFLVTGKEKKALADTIWKNPEEAALHYPAARIRPREELLWYTD